MKENDDWREYQGILSPMFYNAFINHNDLRKVIADYKKISSEREALNLVIKRAVDIAKFKTWLNTKSKYINIYCNSMENDSDYGY